MAKKLKYDNEEVVVDYAIKDDKGNKLSDATIKANNSLQLPETAPTRTKLIGVGADKSQTFIDIGEGLLVENNTLKTTGSHIINLDNELNETSENAVQNKVITENLNNKVSKTGDENIYGIKSFDTRPKLGIGDILPNEYQEVEYIELTGKQ